MWTCQNIVKQAALNRNILEWVRVGEKVMFRIKTNKWKGKHSEEEDTKIPKCIIKGHVESLNE